MFDEQDLREAFLAGMKVQQDTDIINGMFFEEYLDHLREVARNPIHRLRGLDELHL